MVPDQLTLAAEEEGVVAETSVNTRELVEKIRTQVAAERAVRAGASLGPLPAFDLLVHDAERRYLNEHWVFDRAPTRVGSGGRLRGFKGQAKARAGQFVLGVLDRYFDQDQEFRAHLVRLQNRLTEEQDRARAELREVYEALTLELDRLQQAYEAVHTALEERVAALEPSGQTPDHGPAHS